jgi:Flp pilus assembly protein protease CpaA
MFEVYFLWGLALFWILFAVVQDIRTREIANWLNYSLVIFALGFRFFYSLFELDSFSFFYQGAIGFGIFLILGNLFYYGKMFAGGDAKLFMALGAVLPISYSLLLNLRVFMLFVFLFLVVGAIYGLLASLYFGIKYFGNFVKEFKRQNRLNYNFINVFLIFSFALFFSSVFVSVFFYFGIFFFIMPYFYLFIKSVDESCMVKYIQTSKLTEGDWLYKDVFVNKKKIKATWDGVSLEEIALLQKHKEKVWVRYGVQFAPVFLISFTLMIAVIEFGLFGF